MEYGKRVLCCPPAVLLLAFAGLFTTMSAQTAPPLGTAQKFAVLGGATVTNVISAGTILTGDLGVSPGNSITGFPPGIVTGTIHITDGPAGTAQQDALVAYNYLAGEACNRDLTGTDLGGLTLGPGVYCFSSSAQLTGTLTLDATSDPNSVFVFKIGSTLTTASNSSVVMRGGSPCNVFYQVGTSATLGTGTRLEGSLFASASITLTTGASTTGGIYALNGAVTLDDNSVTSCMGTLQVCKVAGSGSLIGTSFGFSIAGNPPTVFSVQAGASPGGACSTALLVPAHPAFITETPAGNSTLAEVSTAPSPGLLIASNLAAGTATVEVDPGGQTVATFVNTVPPPPATGLLEICKVAGSGVSPNTPFVFNVNVAGSALSPITVLAGPTPGNCSPPQQVPAGQALITETLPNGTTLTAVGTLPSAGLLVASNLAAGTATVTINASALTIATFTNAQAPTSGFLQICKVAGSGIAVGTTFGFSIAGNPATTVTVPAGPAPSGSCSTPQQVPAGQSLITETLPNGTTLTSIVTSPDTALLVASNLAAGTATVTVNAGGTTTATFANAASPLTTGFLQICKVAGTGIAVGTNFTFSVAGTPPIVVTVPAGAAPGGSCSPALVATAGQAVITETLPLGTSLTSVSTLPGGSLVSSNLAAGTATVTVAPGGQTIVTFVDTVPTINGSLQICKIAGSGVTVGTNFTFNVAGTPPIVVTVPAGAAPGGSCSTAQVVPAGQALITETLPSGTTLTSVSTLPAGLLVSSNLAAGTAIVTVSAGGQTTATFLDTVIPVIPTTGFLQICKVAGAGVTAGTNFTFTVAGTPPIVVVVPAGAAPGGTCSAAQVVPAGATQITETQLPGAVLTSVSTLPAGLLLSSNLAAGTATVTVNAGGQAIVTFLNAIPALTGLLRICKIAGTGVPVGGTFSFTVAGVSLNVPAGLGPGGACSQALVFPVGTVIPVTETASSGTVLTAMSVVPANAGVINLGGRTASVTIGAGETDVYFTNTAGGVGMLKVCKVAGAGVTAGTTFAFVMGGVGFTVPAGYCVNRGTYPVGTQVTITETASPSTTVSAISVLPAGMAVAINVPNRAATATVGVGVTQVIFTNTARTP